MRTERHRGSGRRPDTSVTREKNSPLDIQSQPRESKKAETRLSSEVQARLAQAIDQRVLSALRHAKRDGAQLLDCRIFARGLSATVSVQIHKKTPAPTRKRLYKELMKIPGINGACIQFAEIRDRACSASGNPIVSRRINLSDHPLERSENHTHKNQRLSELDAEIRRTLPVAVEAHNIRPYEIELPSQGNRSRPFRFFVIKAFVPPEEMAAFVSWRKAFESCHGITIFPRIVPNSAGIKGELLSITEGASVLTDRHIEEIRRRITKRRDSDDPSDNTTDNSPKSAVDLRHIRFVSVDGEATLSREDAFSAVREGNLIRCFITFADATSFAPPDSSRERHARQQVFPLIGNGLAKYLLGKEVAQNLASFQPGKERLGWTVEFTVDPNGVIVWKDPYRARIVNSRAFSYEEIRKEPGILRSDPTLKLVAESFSRVRRSRNSGPRLRRLESDGPGSAIVSDAMILAKQAIASFLEEAGAKALFRNQASPSSEQLARFVKECKAYGIPAEEEDFEDPLKTAAICKALDTAEKIPLLSSLLDMLLNNVSIDSESFGHRTVGADHYCEIKPHKGYWGLANQYALANVLYGEPLPSCLSDKNALRSLEGFINAKLATEDIELYRFRFLAMLQKQLALVGTEMPATITRNRGSELCLEVPGFLKWCTSEKNRPTLSAEIGADCALRTGDSVLVKLMGFDLKKMRFIFSITEEPQRSFAQAA